MVSAPLAGEGQQAAKVARVGYLNPGSSSDPLRQRRFEVFRQSLRELGYVEGQSIAIESRWAEGQYDRCPTLAADLVRLKVDVIVVQGGEATKAPRPGRSRSSCRWLWIPSGAELSPASRAPGETSRGPLLWPLTWSGSS